MNRLFNGLEKGFSLFLLLSFLGIVLSSAPGFSQVESSRSQTVTSSVLLSDPTPDPGQTVTVSVQIDMTGSPAPNNLLGSFTANLNWDPAVMTYVSNSGILQGFTGFVNDLNAANGTLVFNGAKATGQGGMFNVLELVFTAGPSGSTTMDLNYTAMAAAFTFQNLLPILTVNDATVSVFTPQNVVVSSAIPSNANPSTGDPITVAVNIDMTGVAPPDNLLGSFTASLNWDPTKLTYTGNSGILQGFTGFVNDLNAANGVIVFNGAKATGQGGVFDVLIVNFTAGNAGTTPLDLNYTAMAAAFTFTNLLPFLTVNDGEVTVAGVQLPDISVNPTSHNYGNVIVGQSASQTFVVSNVGTADLSVTATTLSGANANQFAIVSGGAPFTVAPGASHDVVVSFNPTSVGAKNASLDIASNDPDEPTVNVALTGTGVAAPEPDITVNPTSHNYGNVTVGGSASQTFVVGNAGTANLSVTATTLTGANPDQFTIVSGGAPFTVAPGATHDVVVSFNPTSAGAKSANLAIASNDPDEPTVNVALSGTGVTGNIVVSSSIPSNANPTTGQAITVAINIDMTGVNPPDDLLGSFTANLNWDPTKLTYTGNSGILQGFTGFVNDLNAANGVIVFNGAKATGQGGVFDVLIVNFTAGDPGTTTLDLNYTAMAAAFTFTNLLPFLTVNDGEVTVAGVQLPDISVNPTSHNYGNVIVGQSASQTFVVSNVGTADLSVTATTLTGTNPDQFTIVSGGAPFTVAPGASHDVVVSFNPTTVGAKSASLDIASNDPDEPTVNVALSGTGVVAPEPDITVNPTSHDYGNVTVGGSASQTFVVGNAGTADLSVTATTLTGANPDQFAIVSGGAPFTVAPGATHDVVVSFNPTSAGAKSASLAIASNDPDEPTVNVALSGTGVEGNIVVSSSIPSNATPTTGDAITVAINIDMTGVNPPDNLLGSFTANLNWDPAVLTYTGNSGILQGFTGFVNDLNAANGVIVFNGAKATGQGGVFDVLIVNFNVVGAPQTSTTLDLNYTAMAAAFTFTNLLPFLTVNDGVVTVAGVQFPDITVNPTSHNYGNVTVGQSASQTFVVGNVGNADLSVTATTLSGANANQFTIVSGGAPFTVAPGASHDVVVSFNPTSGGLKIASLDITSNDPDEPTVNVALSGTGVANNPPVVTQIPDQTMGENTTLVVNVTATDPDGDNLTLAVQNLPSFGVFAVTGSQPGLITGTITFTPGFNHAGVYPNITVTATDDGTPPLSDSESFTLTVQDVNRPPVLDPIPNQTMTEGETLEVDVEADDPDNDDIILTAQNVPSFGDFTDNGDGTGFFTFTPGFNDAGVYPNICVIATDDAPFSKSDTTCFTLTVEDSVVVGDVTPPTCVIEGINPGPPVTLTVRIQDNESGLATINVITAVNANVVIPPFTVGTNDPVIVVATKIDQNQTSTVILEAFDVAGNSVTCDPVYTQLSSIVPDNFSLQQNYPNPFNPTTTIEFGVAAGPTTISLKIYDVTGQLVKTLINNEQVEGGYYRLNWDGTNDKGDIVAAGIYIYRMNAGNFVQTRRMMFVK